MISSDQNINAFHQMLRLVKQYIELKAKVFRLDTTEIITWFLSKVALFACLLLPALFILLFVTIICTIALAKVLSYDWILACAIMSFIYALIGLIIYWNRQAWIVNPITNFIAQAIINLRWKNKN